MGAGARIFELLNPDASNIPDNDPFDDFDDI
jgi:hypothetical protein